MAPKGYGNTPLQACRVENSVGFSLLAEFSDEKWLKKALLQFSHWPGLAQVVPVVIWCLHGHRSWVSSVPSRFFPRVRRDVVPGLAGGGSRGCTRSMGREARATETLKCMCAQGGGDLKDYLTEKKISKSDLYEI